MFLSIKVSIFIPGSPTWLDPASLASDLMGRYGQEHQRFQTFQKRENGERKYTEVYSNPAHFMAIAKEFLWEKKDAN